MDDPRYKRIAEYIKRYMLKHATAGDPLHGERRATARYWHTLSVFKNLQTILDSEGADPETREVAQVAALFHDVDSYTVEHAYHGDRGAETAEKFLAKEDYAVPFIERVKRAIRDHNYDYDDERPVEEQVAEIVRDNPPESLYVMDADILDKIGASNILAAVMPLGLSDKHAYEAARMLTLWPLERAQFWASALTTATGRGMGAQRLAFYGTFIAQLRDEIALTDPFLGI